MSRTAGGLARTSLTRTLLLCGATVVATAGLAVAAVGAKDPVEPPVATVATPDEGRPTGGTCPAPTPAGEPRPTVAFVGDSTTALAAMPTPLAPRGALVEVFGDDFEVVVSAHHGHTLGEALGAVAEALDGPGGPPDALVVTLGTNDAVRDTSDWEPSFERLLDLVDGHPCVLLVTVNERTDAFAGVTGVATAINARIAAADAAHPAIHRVVWNEDWDAESGFTPGRPHHHAVYAPPDALPPDLAARFPMGMWVRDGVHQSPEGSVELAHRMRAVLDADAHRD